jgi:8-oxo-dGTP diphosphatase
MEPISDGRVSVVAAVIRRDGRILIGQRRKGTRHGLKWEFPGGKVETGEDPRRAIERELREELEIVAEAGEEITRFAFQYPQRGPIELIFYAVESFRGEPKCLAFEQIVWETPERLTDYDFLDADVEFVKNLARR